MLTTHEQWFAGLDAPMRAEARSCLLDGTYSRRLLVSLRDGGPPVSPREHGLDDPERAEPGDPLGANLQTFLRERLVAAAHPLRALPRTRAVEPVPVVRRG